MRTWLRDLRITNELTQQALAERCNISRTFYTLIENGMRRPSVEIAKSIAEVLGFDWTLFFKNEDKASA